MSIGNCGDGGQVVVYLNLVQIGAAISSGTINASLKGSIPFEYRIRKNVTFAFAHGDIVEIRDEKSKPSGKNGTRAVVVIESIRIECTGVHSTHLFVI